MMGISDRDERIETATKEEFKMGLVFGKFRGLTFALAILGAVALIAACGRDGGEGTDKVTGVTTDVSSIIKERQLSAADVSAALKTFMPTGRHDEFIMFASGGHSGQALAIGVPSMRILKVIGVFTPEPWQGWGFSKETKEILYGEKVDGKTLTWGDVHHPALSETNGNYDGQYLFVNDKAHARIAVIDLKDFETKQIVKNPVAINDHGGAFVTPNTEWVIEGGQYATPTGWEYAPIEEYREKYRGMITFWKFDREAGRIDKERSFAMELPPYWQDLADAGKGISEGWVFLNSFNTEMATGGIEKGEPPFEAGASQSDMDYLHVFNIEKLTGVVAAGKTKTVNGMKVIPLDVAVEEKLIHLIPEPKSPHGIDVAPKGDFLVISGKLDPHVTIFNFEKVLAAIKNETFSGRDDYGIPILDFDAVLEAQIEVGLGPLHTQFDNKGYAYTSLFLESTVARWTLGGQYGDLNPEPDWSLVGKTDIHYNVGHISVAGGDIAEPYGRYLVSMNKWSVDRFQAPGPLLPQNFQLLDIADEGENMPLLYDMPIGIGEPHYAQIIRADLLQPWEVYPEVGWDPATGKVDPNAAKPGNEGIVRDGKNVTIRSTLVRSHFKPEIVEINKGDNVTWHFTNIERAKDATHGFAVPPFNVNLSLEPGEAATVEFTADKAGIYPFYCTEFCSALHLEMTGYLIVRP